MILKHSKSAFFFFSKITSIILYNNIEKRQKNARWRKVNLKCTKMIKFNFILIFLKDNLQIMQQIKGGPQNYLMTRTSHKFRLKTDKVNKSFSNPLYSKKSLDRYYYQKQNKNYSSQATLSRSVKKIPSKSEGTINILIKNLSKFHGNQGCTSKKIKLLSNYQQKIQNHYQKVKTIPDVEQGQYSVRQQNYLDERIERKNPELKLTSEVAKKIHRDKVHQQHLKVYLQKQKQWARYGYQPDFSDDQRVIQESIFIRNKKLRKKSKVRQYRPPVLVSARVDDKIVNQSRKYMHKLTESFQRQT